VASPWLYITLTLVEEAVPRGTPLVIGVRLRLFRKQNRLQGSQGQSQGQERGQIQAQEQCQGQAAKAAPGTEPDPALGWCPSPSAMPGAGGSKAGMIYS